MSIRVHSWFNFIVTANKRCGFVHDGNQSEQRLRERHLIVKYSKKMKTLSGKMMMALLAGAHLVSLSLQGGESNRPNIVLVMADDQGWGQVGYYDHPHLQTPELDAMAEAGLPFDRFYAAGPVCSPTRASVLTARTPNRSGVFSHGWNLCLQEKTLPRALRQAGYATGHFGKWHLNGVRGAGVPILGDDANHPGHYGFDEWQGMNRGAWVTAERAECPGKSPPCPEDAVGQFRSHGPLWGQSHGARTSITPEKKVHKWLDRYAAEGSPALKNCSRRPRGGSHQTAAGLVDVIRE